MWNAAKARYLPTLAFRRFECTSWLRGVVPQEDGLARCLAASSSRASITTSAHAPPWGHQGTSLSTALPIPLASLLDESLSVEDDDSCVINHDLFGQYKSFPAMAKAVAKDDILVIVSSLSLIKRRHRILLQHLTTNVVNNLHLWTAPDLAELCTCLLQLGFLHEDLCVAMTDRVLETADLCSASELCWLLDAYASNRCLVASVVATIAKESASQLHKFRIHEVARHASSLSRLQ
eukprot:651955-Amphidinium_carterae.1